MLCDQSLAAWMYPLLASGRSKDAKAETLDCGDDADRARGGLGDRSAAVSDANLGGDPAQRDPGHLDVCALGSDPLEGPGSHFLARVCPLGLALPGRSLC